MKPAVRVPTLFELMILRMSRTSMKIAQDYSYLDYRYYSERGWFDSDYYYPVRLGMLQRSAGKLFDSIFSYIHRSRADSVPSE